MRNSSDTSNNDVMTAKDVIASSIHTALDDASLDVTLSHRIIPATTIRTVILPSSRNSTSQSSSSSSSSSSLSPASALSSSLAEEVTDAVASSSSSSSGSTLNRVPLPLYVSSGSPINEENDAHHFKTELEQTKPTSWSCPRLPTQLLTLLSWLKMTLSLILITFSVVVVSAAILTKQTVATGQHHVPPIVALVLFWGSLWWLAIMEGGLNCMVGLQPLPATVYQHTHPNTYRCTQLISPTGPATIERFIVGRQYLDLLIVFVTSFMVSARDGASVLGLPPLLNQIFLDYDVAVILCTIVFGQLIAQINCAHAMLDFINTYGMLGSTYLALLVEASGILHAVYLFQILFTKLATKQKHNKNTKTKAIPNDHTTTDETSYGSRTSSRSSSHKNSHDKTDTTVTTAHDSSSSISASSNSSESNGGDGSVSIDSNSSRSSGDSDIEDEDVKELDKKENAIEIVVFEVPSSTNATSDHPEDVASPCPCQSTQRSGWQRCWFWCRVLFSVGISLFALVVICTALVQGETTVHAMIPVPVSFLSLLLLVVLGGFLEALQIALFAVKHVPSHLLAASPIAQRNCAYVLGQTVTTTTSTTTGTAPTTATASSRLQSFLVGRQIVQTVIMFMIARIITVDMHNNDDGTTLLGVSVPIQTLLFQSGILQALLSTIFASLVWRVTANYFPLVYLRQPVSRWLLQLCLCVAGTGLCDAAWLFAKLPAVLFRYRPDADYLRAAAANEDDPRGEDVEQGRRCSARTTTTRIEGSNHR